MIFFVEHKIVLYKVWKIKLLVFDAVEIKQRKRKYDEELRKYSFKRERATRCSTSKPIQKPSTLEKLLGERGLYSYFLIRFPL